MGEGADRGDRLPYPERPPPSIDPTLLTTEQLLREIGGLRELLLAKMAVADTKMTGHFLIDTERFVQIEERFNLIERQRLEQKTDTGTSISAALDAQKSQTSALDGKIDDLKERVGRIESVRQGAVETRAEGRATLGSTTAVIGGAVALVLVVLAILGYSASRRAPNVIVPPSAPVTTTVAK